MKHVKFRIASIAVVAAAVSLAAVAKGGDLDPPPGPITPTMKTLDDVEPRTILYPEEGSKGGSRQAVLTIGTPGSYVLGAPLTGLAGLNGVEISASNVTLDLRGFTVQGVSGSLDGIVVTGAFNNISIYNGTVDGWDGDGVDAYQALGCRIRDLRVSNNGGYGIQVGSGLVSHCWVGANTGATIGRGILANTWTLVSDCIVTVVWAPGIGTGSHSTVRDCQLSGVSTFTGLGYASIEVGSDCRVIGNSMTEWMLLRADGIYATGVGNHIEGNVIVAVGVTAKTGIVVTGTGNLIVKNSLYNYTTPHSIVAGNAFGTFLNVAGGGAFVSNEPWANLLY